MARILIALPLALLPNLAHAQLCIAIDGTKATNNCGSCQEITVRELRPENQRQDGLFSGAERTVKLEHGQSTALGGTGKWVLGHMQVCR